MHREENLPSLLNYYLIYVKQIYVPTWGPISLIFSKILDKFNGKSRPPTHQIKDKKMVRFGRTHAFSCQRLSVVDWVPFLNILI